MSATEQPLPPLEHVHTLAGDLIRALSDHPGDDEAVCTVLTRWHEGLDTRIFSLVCMAALRATFGECLIPHPESVPADGLTIAPVGVAS